MCAQFFSDFISVGNVTGQIIGLPPSFIQTYKMAGDFTLPVQAPSYNHKPLKNPEVPELDSYHNNPGEEFWKLFPFVPLPGTTYLKYQGPSAPPPLLPEGWKGGGPFPLSPCLMGKGGGGGKGSISPTPSPSPFST